jgi:hypothetical protein
MKKTVTLFVIVAMISVANIQIFSQKIRNVSIKKLPVTKTETPTDTKLQSADAFSDGNGVYIRWQAEYESRNLGFFIYRLGAKGRELVSQEMVAGGYTKSSETLVYGEKYSYFDAGGNLATTYQIESLGINGQRQIVGQVSPKPVSNLASVAGSSSQELKNRTAVEPVLENNSLNLPKELQTTIADNSLSPDINTQRWVAAQPGVKIAVKQEGIYRVSRTELQNAGFNVNAPGNLWQLYVDGNQQSINVGAGDSYIEFYGKGIDTPESDTKVYYLIVGTQDGLRMGTTFLRPLSGAIIGSSYYQTFERKERKIYINSDILNGDAENFFGNVPIVGSNSPTPSIMTYTFNLTAIDYNSRKSTVVLNIQGITATPHQIVSKLNGNPMDPINGNGDNLMSGTFEIPTSMLNEGTNTLQIQTFGGSGDINLVESIRVSYGRKYEAIQNRLSFFTNNYRQSTVSGFTSPNIRMLDLTFPDNPTLLTNLNIQNNAGNYSVTLPANRGRQIFAAEDLAILSASSVVANNPSTLSTAAHNGELIIVTYKDWLTQANDWANYRRAQGLTVEVVDIEDIQDEFSYGSVDTSGITQFFQYAKNNWQTPPNYVLLLGDFSYDFRNYENRAFQNYIPTKRVDTLFEETGSDEALCDFNNDGLAELAVGRIPARSAANVTQALNKTMVFESNLATAYSRGGLCASDMPIGYDFEGLCQRVFAQLPPSIPTTFINRGQTDSHNLLLSSMNTGRYLVNYSGHGSAGVWSDDNSWFTIPNATALNNSPNYTLYFMLTCLNGYFLRTDFDSLSEALLKAPNGGGVAVWASTGKTTPDVQELLATRFYNQLNVGNMTKIGDLIKDAKQNLTAGRDVRLSWALLGDPTLKIKP